MDPTRPDPARAGAAPEPAPPGTPPEAGRGEAAPDPARLPRGPHAHPPNRLIREKSPYLLQHAHNPVDWYPWGEEAFDRARAEEKPILLSIGYSTCHWCHVMERESFEDEGIAALLSDWFVAIKVDREERPDVDRLYMSAAQAMGLGGGWPLNLFLTPALEPFYGGTYFGPDSRYGRPSFRDVLEAVHRAWSGQRGDVETQGARVLAALAAWSETASAPDRGATDDQLLAAAFRGLERNRDPRNGGFGSAPKFPSIANLDFLLRYWSGDPASRGVALALVLRQLDAMRAGGIHDHLGGGFHRYATDAQWLVPHFEKMLYDQAQCAGIYVDAFLATGRAEYAATARDVLDYVARDLTSPDGAFHSAEDADSEGGEGRFYVWTPDQTAAALGPEDAGLFDAVYGVTRRGNFEDGRTVLHLARPVAEVARERGLDAADAEARLGRARARLLEARSRRVRPARDDKVLAAWNGLMISAFSRAARAFDDPLLAARAARAADFAWSALRDPATGALRRRWREGEAAGEGQLADHAALALGFLDLYQAVHEPEWLARAADLAGRMVERFADPAVGGFFESPPDPHLRVRMKEAFDGAEIAGASLAAYVVRALGELLERPDWREQAERCFGYYRGRLADDPWSMPRMLVAMDLGATPGRQVVISGDPEAPATRALIREFDRRFLPRDLLLVSPGGGRGGRLADLVPFVASLIAREGHPAAYVCLERECRLPVWDPAALGVLLEEIRVSGR